MKLLKKINYIIAILVLTMAFTHFFIKDINMPTYSIPSILSVFFLLIGIEKVMEGMQVKNGYFYIGLAIIGSLVVIKNVLGNISL